MRTGGVLIYMNKNGNPGTLVRAHPGNTNALKFGVHSDRTIAPRAAEIAAQISDSFEFSITELIAVQELARCMAVIEMIDCDLDARGVVDKRGEPRYLMTHRSRMARELERWLAKVTSAIERQSARAAENRPGRPEYVRELERIALGQDSSATARDRVSALRVLLSVEPAVKSPPAMSLTVRITEEDELFDILSDEDAGSSGER